MADDVVPHTFDANAVDWSNHPTLAGVSVKVLETPASHPHARVSLARVGPGGEIPAHVHETEIETAFVLTGRGEVWAGNRTFPLSPGMGVTVPMGLEHGLRNTGDGPIELYAVHTRRAP